LIKPDTKYARSVYWTVSIIIYLVKLLGRSFCGLIASSATVIGYSKLVYPKKATAVPFMTPYDPFLKKGCAFFVSKITILRMLAY
jgi:hypothetical protein